MVTGMATWVGEVLVGGRDGIPVSLAKLFCSLVLQRTSADTIILLRSTVSILNRNYLMSGLCYRKYL